MQRFFYSRCNGVRLTYRFTKKIEYINQGAGIINSEYIKAYFIYYSFWESMDARKMSQN